MGGVVRFLAHDGIVGVVAIADAAAPIFFVGPDMGVAGVLACHEGGARRGRHGAAGIRLGEAHPFGGKAVDVGRGDKLLAVASQVAITHVVAHDVKDIGPRLRPGGQSSQTGTAAENNSVEHSIKDKVKDRKL